MRSGFTPRIAASFAPMIPRVMLLAVFTEVVGFMIASRHLDPLLGSAAILAIAAGAGAAGVLALAFGMLIVTLVVASSLWITDNLNENLMPAPEQMNLHTQR